MTTQEVEQVQTLVREIIKASCDIQKKVRARARARARAPLGRLVPKALSNMFAARNTRPSV